MILPMIFLAVILTATFLAIRAGGPPERLAAGIIITWTLLDAIYHVLFGPSGFDKVDPVHVVLDSGYLVGIMWVALRANRMWPLWAAAAQLICVSGHLVAYIEPGGYRRAYWAMTQMPQYIQLTALLLGATFHKRRFRRLGPYRSWRLA